MSKYTGRIQQIFGVIMIITAIGIFTNYDKVLQVKLLDAFPSFSGFVNNLESSDTVKNQLEILKKKKEEMRENMPKNLGSLPDLGEAPEFRGISKWLNPTIPLTMKSLRGKVILVDFWTYTCINCIRTLPHVTNWYDRYHDKGFVVVGVHTPEFEFEKNTDNVLNAIKQYKIHYPVAQDNDFGTWNAFSNQYWPAEYLIDANGHIRHVHFGENEYEETEHAIQDLLKEAGQKIDTKLTDMPDETPTGRLTPETYIGSNRQDRKSDNTEGLPLHYFALGGKWDVKPEYAQAKSNASLTLHFYAQKVFLVITPKIKGDKVKVYLDGKLNNTITLDDPRLYDIVKLNEVEDHTVKLEFTDGTQIFAFTFG